MFYTRAGTFFGRVRETASSKTSLTHKLKTKPAGFGIAEPRRQTKARFTRYSKGVTVRMCGTTLFYHIVVRCSSDSVLK